MKKDQRWESLDPADESFVDQVLRAGRDELPDDARLGAIEERLGGVLEKEPPPSGWWSRSRLFYPVVGLAVVALGVRAGGSALSAPAPSAPAAVAATEPAPAVVAPAPSTASVAVETPPSMASVAVDALPTAEPLAAEAKQPTSMPEAKPRAEASPSRASAPTDELAVLEEASRALDAKPERTLALTDEHMKRFRSPKFAQERERLAIVALVRLGRRADAKRRADAFEAAFPGSAHLTRVRELVRP